MDGINVYGAEVSLTDTFETAGLKNWTQIKGTNKNIAFQKEACINLIVRNIPNHIKKIAWIDHDFLFMNTNWVSEASEKLNQYKAIQLFSNYILTDISGRPTKDIPCVIGSCINPNGTPNENRLFHRVGMPGCAWAARRELWDNGGLYPYCFLGGGDSLFFYTVVGFPMSEKLSTVIGLPKTLEFSKYQDWKKAITNYIGYRDIAFISGQIVHEWHGNTIDRKYETRYKIVENIDFNRCISLNDSGLVEITEVNENVYHDILSYFKNRKEDSLTSSP